MTEELIVVTGATKGLGLGMTRWFASHGHKVIGCGRTVISVEQLNEQFPTGTFAVVDITQEAQVKKWSQEMLAQYGAPSFLINNAGVINYPAKLWEVPPEQFEEVIDVNIKGTANVIRHFVPEMVERKRGVIVNFSSRWGRTVSTHRGPYCASKWAIEGMSRVLALELPKPMVCVPLNPGVINTSMVQMSCGGEEASTHETAEAWAERACPYILKIGSAQNGSSSTIPS